MTTTATHDWTELASRATDALAVSLLWSRATGRIRITVADQKFDEQLELDVPGAHALGAFYHPFAYAAVRGLDFGSADRDSIHLQTQERSAA